MIHVSFSFPIWPFWVYPLIGLVLFVPLVFWGNRFISGNRKAFESVNVPKAIFFSAFTWPVIVFVYAKTEISYRKKGYL